MGAMKPQSAQANKVTVLAVPLVIAVVECAAMLWEHAIGAPADTMYTFAKDPLGLALLLGDDHSQQCDTACPLLAASRCLGA